MKKTHSEKMKKYWATIPKEQRTQVAQELVRVKLAKMTPEEKSAHMRMMVMRRWEKVASKKRNEN